MSESLPKTTDTVAMQLLDHYTPAGLTTLATFCRTMIAHSPIPLAIIRGSDHLVECVSLGFARLVEREVADLCGHPLDEVLAGIQTLDMLNALDHAYRTGEDVSVQETPHSHPQHGLVAWTYVICPIPDRAGHPSALLLEMQDTTAQQRTAQAADEIRSINEQLVLNRLHEHTITEQLGVQLAFIQALTHSLSDGVYALDTSGRVSYVNHSAERMLGWMATDLVGQSAQAVIAVRVHATTAEQGDAPPFGEVLRSGVLYRDDDALLTQRDGTTLTVAYTLAPIQSAGAIIGAVAVMHDVSTLRRLQHTREEYLTLLSHDLRSPLTTISGTAELLQRRLQKHDLPRETAYAETIISSSRRMNSMIQDVLDQSALEGQGHSVQTTYTTFDLSFVLRLMVKQLPTVTERNRIQLETVDHLMIAGDVTQIERVLVNLLSNALKYSPSDRPVAVQLSTNGQQALVSVRDEGVGIHTEDLPQLFAKYYRARTAGDVKGTGLGLYSSQLIVAAHGGQLWVESTVGVGSTFSVAFPIAHPIANHCTHAHQEQP